MLRELVDQISELNQNIAQADVNSIWRYASANPPSRPSDIDALESEMGRALCRGYRAFLECADGWSGFYHDVNLFSCADFLAREPVDRAWDLVETADDGSGGLLEVSRQRYLPIGAATFDIDVFLVDLNSEDGAVRWIAGQQIEQFSSFADFLAGMARYSEESLADLRNDPWLGVGP